MDPVSVDLQSEDASAAPVKPKRKWKTRVKKTLISRTPRFEDIGPMPTNDPLAMNSWVHRALGVSAAQVVRDPDLNDSQRRSQLCDIAARMSGLTDQSRIYGAESVVRGHEAGLKSGSGPAMEMVNDAPEAIAATSGARTARRGRPRKRGLG